jgi:glucose-6-phosphate 1-epimerase
MWQLVSTARLDNGATQVVLGMQDSDATRAIWPHAFAMRLEVTVGQSLSMALVTRNTGDSAFTLTQALHTYFSIGNIRQVQVLGLEATEYLDKVDDWQRKTQTGALTVDKEVDRVYLEVRPELVIDDQVFGRRIRIASRGNKTAVLWNPWSKIAAEMADLENDDYLRFVCVETTNAADDVVEVMPGNEFRLEAVYSVEG